MRTKVKIMTMYFMALLRYYKIKKKKLRKPPAYRVNPYLKKRRLKGRFFKDFEDLKKHKTAFTENFHMDLNIFENLFLRVQKHLICKKRTRKDEISPKEKFASVIEFLASGTLQRHIASLYRISKQRFGKIIDSVCDAIIKELKSEIPEMNEQTFLKIADGFTEKWNFPNCLGAIDGKHVAIKAPPKSGSLFYNYKGFFSLVCMAISDAEYRFTYLDIGAFGSEGDSNILLSSDFGKRLLNEDLNFPANKVLDEEELPFYFIGDTAFPLAKRMMKPFSAKAQFTEEQRIFNYRLSRARRCVENAFGILCTKWLCLKKTLFCHPERAQKIITATCLLHNYLLNVSPSKYISNNYVDRYNDNGNLIPGEWRSKVTSDCWLQNPKPLARGRNLNEGKDVREKLMKYMTTTGAIPWQRQACGLE